MDVLFRGDMWFAPLLYGEALEGCCLVTDLWACWHWTGVGFVYDANAGKKLLNRASKLDYVTLWVENVSSS